MSTIEERMGDAAEAMLALCYAMPGMPLIYSGQEYDMNHRLKFFEKDSISKEKGKMWPKLQRLGELKNTVPALNGGKDAASYERIQTNDYAKIIAFSRKKGDSEVVLVINASDAATSATLEAEGDYVDAFSDENIFLSPSQSREMGPWEYWLLVK
ncbi:hypothetical protein MG296_13220 [Flavobacteriaceae bacterium TK19130]|nr:hypothetical protein [Thermobacterium salinum]